MQKELQIFAMAKVVADAYKARYDKADKKRKEAWKDLNDNYVPGSTRFKEFKATIEPEFQAEISTAKDEILSEFEQEFEDLQRMEIAKVKIVTQGSEKIMDILSRLSNIPLSTDEFNFLVEQYGNHGYWPNRQLINLGIKNGIQECAVSPDITTKLGLLNELKNNLYLYVDKYQNDNSYSTDVLISDAVIQKLERQYTNNYSGILMDAREAGKRIVTEALNKPDSMERSMYLANSLRTSSPDIQDGILYEICKNHEDIVHEPVMRLTGVSALMEDYEKSEYEGMCRAERIVDAIRNEPKKYERETIVLQNLDDKYFIEAVGKSGDSGLKDLVRHVREIRKAGEEKEQREAKQNGVNEQ